MNKNIILLLSFLSIFSFVHIVSAADATTINGQFGKDITYTLKVSDYADIPEYSGVQKNERWGQIDFDIKNKDITYGIYSFTCKGVSEGFLKEYKGTSYGSEVDCGSKNVKITFTDTQAYYGQLAKNGTLIFRAFFNDIDNKSKSRIDVNVKFYDKNNNVIKDEKNKDTLNVQYVPEKSTFGTFLESFYFIEPTLGYVTPKDKITLFSTCPDTGMMSYNLKGKLSFGLIDASNKKVSLIKKDIYCPNGSATVEIPKNIKAGMYQFYAQDLTNSKIKDNIKYASNGVFEIKDIKKPKNVTLDIKFEGSGSGIVTKKDEKGSSKVTKCSKDCTEDFPYGELSQIKLNAIADIGSVFEKWSPVPTHLNVSISLPGGYANTPYLWNTHTNKIMLSEIDTEVVATFKKYEVDENTYTRDLKTYDYGDDVDMLAEFLRMKGYYDYTNNYASGLGFTEFSRKMSSALSNYQKDNGIKATGLFDVETRAFVISKSPKKSTASITETTTPVVPPKTPITPPKKDSILPNILPPTTPYEVAYTYEASLKSDGSIKYNSKGRIENTIALSTKTNNPNVKKALVTFTCKKVDSRDCERGLNIRINSKKTNSDKILVTTVDENVLTENATIKATVTFTDNSGNKVYSTINTNLVQVKEGTIKNPVSPIIPTKQPTPTKITPINEVKDSYPVVKNPLLPNIALPPLPTSPKITPPKAPKNPVSPIIPTQQPTPTKITPINEVKDSHPAVKNPLLPNIALPPLPTSPKITPPKAPKNVKYTYEASLQSDNSIQYYNKGRAGNTITLVTKSDNPDVKKAIVTFTCKKVDSYDCERGTTVKLNNLKTHFYSFLVTTSDESIKPEDATLKAIVKFTDNSGNKVYSTINTNLVQVKEKKVSYIEKQEGFHSILLTASVQAAFTEIIKGIIMNTGELIGIQY